MPWRISNLDNVVHTVSGEPFNVRLGEQDKPASTRNVIALMLNHYHCDNVIQANLAVTVVSRLYFEPGSDFEINTEEEYQVLRDILSLKIMPAIVMAAINETILAEVVGTKNENTELG